MVVMSDLGAPHTAEEFFGPIRASAVQAVRLLMVDPLHLVAAVKIVPGAGFIGVHDGSFSDT